MIHPGDQLPKIAIRNEELVHIATPKAGKQCHKGTLFAGRAHLAFSERASTQQKKRFDAPNNAESAKSLILLTQTETLEEAKQTRIKRSKDRSNATGLTPPAKRLSQTSARETI